MAITKRWSLVDSVQAPARQNAVLEETAHRPWPLPESSWVMGQTWEDLLFAHWRAPADALRALLLHFSARQDVFIWPLEDA